MREGQNTLAQLTTTQSPHEIINCQTPAPEDHRYQGNIQHTLAPRPITNHPIITQQNHTQHLLRSSTRHQPPAHPKGRHSLPQHISHQPIK